MRYFLRLGLRNVFRQKLRSGLALAAIGISVVMVTVGMTMTRGVEREIFGELVRDNGEMVIARQEYFEKSRFNPLRYQIRDARSLQDALLQIPGVKAASLRIDFGLLLENQEQTKSVRATAVDREQFARWSSIPSKIVAGGYFEEGQKGILVGKWVADALHLTPGQTVTVLGKTVYDSFIADELKVVGIFDLGSTQANRSSYLPIETAQEFLEMDNAVSRILVYGESYHESERIAEGIRHAKILPEGVALRTWRENSFLSGIYALVSGVRVVLSVIICFVAGLGILNMMTVSVMERRKEIGVLMALGMPHSGIVVSFFYEAILYGVIGSVFGVMVGSGVSLYLSTVGIHIPIEHVQGLPIQLPGESLRGEFRWTNPLIGASVGVLLSILGMLVPVTRTFSMGPQDAMKRG